MINEILFALWFLLPAGIANMAPILVAKAPYISRWNTPIDFKKSYRGVRIFGDHKTWRGLTAGIVAAAAVFMIQVILFDNYQWAKTLSGDVNYAELTLLLGPLLGLGALGGDAIESFFKRRSGVEPGHAWVPFDQLDYIAGAVLLSLPVIVLSWTAYIYIFSVWFGAHLLASFIGYKLGLKDAPI